MIELVNREEGGEGQHSARPLYYVDTYLKLGGKSHLFKAPFSAILLLGIALHTYILYGRRRVRVSIGAPLDSNITTAPINPLSIHPSIHLPKKMTYM